MAADGCSGGGEFGSEGAEDGDRSFAFQAVAVAAGALSEEQSGAEVVEALAVRFGFVAARFSLLIPERVAVERQRKLFDNNHLRFIRRYVAQPKLRRRDVFDIHGSCPGAEGMQTQERF